MAESILLELSVTELSVHAKRQKPRLLNKDGCFLGVVPNVGLQLA